MYLYLIQILIITVFLPLSLFYLLIMLGKVDSVMISNVSQRKTPLIIHIVLLTFLITQTIVRNKMPELYYFFAGSILSSFFALILVFFNQKASLHIQGTASLSIFCIGLCLHFQIKEYVLISILILLNGLVASSRLYMKAHTEKELIIGFLIGSIPQIISLYFWL
jgi:membrane-associated phospholipid phosphatase